MGTETSNEFGEKTTISAPFNPNMKAKVPKGNRQRRRASNTQPIVKAVISRISVIPRFGELLVSIIGQGVINGEAYAVKKVNSEKVKVSERMAGPSCRQDVVPPDLRHAARNGPLSARPIPSARPRWVGLRSASVLRSTKNSRQKEESRRQKAKGSRQ